MLEVILVENPFSTFISASCIDFSHWLKGETFKSFKQTLFTMNRESTLCEA